MLSVSPADSCHFLPLDGLKGPDMTVWELREDDRLLGCGALKEIDPSHGEIKSMHTAMPARGRGLARQMLRLILDTAAARGYQRLSLETGTAAAFVPAIRLYESHGFTPCGPFGTYPDSPHSLFMTRTL